MTCREAELEHIELSVLVLSASGSWETCRTEWFLDAIHFEDAPETCVCGGYPCRWVCLLVNRRTTDEHVVSAECAYRFFEIDVSQVFQGLMALTMCIDASIPLELIEYACANRWLTTKAAAFLRQIRYSRKLKPPQAAFRRTLNIAILSKCSNTLSVRRINGY
jgi:hypothetical protein